MNRLTSTASDVSRATSEETFRRAAAFHRENRLDEAEALYVLALKAAPDHHGALCGLGFLQRNQNRVEEALAQFQAATKSTPSSAIAWSELGRCFLALGRWQEAVTAFEHTCGLQPDSAEAYYNLGNALHVVKRYADAVTSYETALALRSDHPQTHDNLGSALQNIGQYDDAISHHLKALALAPDFAEAAYNLGNSLWSSGRRQEAVTSYERAISIKPELFEAHYNLGNSLQSLGMHQAAADRLKAAIALRPDFSEAHCSLAGVLHALARHDEAIAHYEKAIAITPDDFKTHCNFGNLLYDLERTNEAIAQYEIALTLNPDYAEAHYNTANALQVLGRHSDAIAHYNKAIALNPNYAEAHNNCGNALQAENRNAEAIERYQTALALNPNYAEARYNYGLALQSNGQDEDAIVQYQHAIALNPGYAQIYNNLGNLMHVLGRQREALDAFDKAIATDPQPRFYRNMAEARRFAVDDPHFIAMARRAESSEVMSDEDRTDLYFALGKAYDDIGDYDRAFGYFRDGNALKRQNIPYDEVKALGLFSRVASVFTRQLMRDQADSGDASSGPIFVVGMPRSGTTLVEQVLASHPAVHGAGELDYFGTEAARPSESGLPFIEGGSLLDAVRTKATAELRGLGQRYMHAIRPLAPTKDRIVDKQTANFLHIGLIHLALPRARIVHVYRDPMDTCFSCFSKLFTNKQYFSYHLGELGRYYRAYTKLMDHWRDILPTGIMLEVRYEDFVGDLDSHARRLISYCGLDWDPSCLAFHTTQRAVRTASAGQVRRPLYHTSVGRSRVYRKHLGPLIDALGREDGAETTAAI